MVWVRLKKYIKRIFVLKVMRFKYFQRKTYTSKIFNLKILYTRAYVYKMFNMYKRKSCINYKYSTGKSSHTRQIV